MKPMMETGPPQKETIHFRYKCWDTAGRFLPWRSQKPLRAVASAQGWILGAVIQGHQHSYARALLSASQGGWAASTFLLQAVHGAECRCSEPRQRKGSLSFPSSVSVVLRQSLSSCLEADPADPFWDFRLAMSFVTLCPMWLALGERSAFWVIIPAIVALVPVFP